MLNGLIPLGPWGALLIALGLTHITIAGVTIYLHRHQAHRALELHPAVSHFFRFWLWLTTGMRTKEWVAVHRKHHAKVESPEDPHSPQVFGLRRVLFGGVSLYRREAANPQTLAKYGHATPDDWVERHLYTAHADRGLMLMLLLDVILFGWVGLLIWLAQLLWIPLWAAGVINGVGHALGYRNYETADASTNIVPWGILIGGEELHNNHHAYPSSAKLSSRWWELDIGWLYIRVLEVLGTARVKKLAPVPVVLPSKGSIDAETVRAVVVNRLHVMASYARTVMIPVVREEMAKADASWRSRFRQARRLLVREESRIDAKGRQRLDRVLGASQRLATVYQFRRRLQEIWQRTAASQDELCKALQDWCRRAEETGIHSLGEFADYLRGYGLRAPRPLTQ